LWKKILLHAEIFSSLQKFKEGNPTGVPSFHLSLKSSHIKDKLHHLSILSSISPQNQDKILIGGISSRNFCLNEDVLLLQFVEHGTNLHLPAPYTSYKKEN
jgi:hypothetical protein